MEPMLYTISPYILAPSCVGAPLSSVIGSSVCPDDNISKAEETIFGAGGLVSVACTAGSCLAFIGGVEYSRAYSSTQAYIQSLSKEELEQLSEELILISDSQNTEELIVELSTINSNQDGLDVDSSKEGMQEAISNYLDSLEEGEFAQTYNELEMDQRIEESKQLRKTK